MMKKVLMIGSLALLLGACQSEPGISDPETKPAKPVSPQLQQKIETLNAGLGSLKVLSEAVSQSEVRSLTEDDAGVHLIFGNGVEVTLICNDEAAGAPLIGIAADEELYYWTLAAEKDMPWLRDASGQKMPVSGAVPIVGVDDEGFWTVTTDAAVEPWPIADAAGNPIEATGEEHVELFGSVKAENGHMEIRLSDGTVLSAGMINDLSRAGTANCYVVSTPGTYVFNAAVRGNGVGEDVGYEAAIEIVDGMTADWLWTDAEGLVSKIALDVNNAEISFRVGEGKGNASIALVKEGQIVWSWHIWATDAPQTVACKNGVVLMDRNVGAVGTTVGGTDAYGLYYQWGRKDPFYFGLTTETSSEAFKEAKAHTTINPAYVGEVWQAATGTFSTADYAAAHPMTFLYNKVGVSSYYDWLAKPNSKMWGAAKTLNDPCPAGYKVPQMSAWSDFSEGRQYIDGVSAWDGVNYGMTYAHDGESLWFPAQGYRNQSTGSLVGLASTRTGNYWSSETAAQTSRFFYFQKKLSTSSGSINTELDKSRAYGYSVRCCKE